MKKALSILLVVVMTVSLAACAGGSAQENSVNQQNTTSSATVAPATAAPAAAPTLEPAKELNLYGFDEPVNIKVGISYAAASDFVWYGGETVTDNAWMRLYKEKNIIPEILYDVDPSQIETKLSTAIMSGNYPDIFQTTPAEYKTYVESGVVADITDVFEEYASDELKDYMVIDGGTALDALKVDGKLYALPKVTYPYSSSLYKVDRQT